MLQCFMDKIRLLLPILASCFCLNAAAQGLLDESAPPLDAEALLKEYSLLYTDLSNIGTNGYKSYFDNRINKASDRINISQGALLLTEVSFDFAIIGEGFFKIRLENGAAGYTRNGNFHIDADGKPRTVNNYYLYDEISLPECFLSETLRTARDGNLYISVPVKGGISEVHVGRLLIYSIPVEYLKHYKDAVYIVKSDVEYNETTVTEPRILNKVLENNNLYIQPAVLRMYYILNVLNENHIPNIAFKRDLLKMQVERMADDRMFDVLLGSMQNDIAKINNLLTEHFILSKKEDTADTPGTIDEWTSRHIKNMNRHRELVSPMLAAQYIIDNRNAFLTDILPYLKL